jgi:hypothetical protein
MLLPYQKFLLENEINPHLADYNDGYLVNDSDNDMIDDKAKKDKLKAYFKTKKNL